MGMTKELKGGTDGIEVAPGTLGAAAACIRAVVGREQEEQIRQLCEAEKDWWRQRPRVKELSSLGKPMSETRNRIREVLLVREDNWWINPKSGVKEHLALKYMNFSRRRVDPDLPS